VDDCSVDDTEKVVKSYSDSRIKYLKSKINQGGGAARNIGIEFAQGQYVAFQDSDDVWLPDKLERCMDSFSQSANNVGVVFSSYLKCKDNLLYLVPDGVPSKLIKVGDLAIVGKNYIGTPTAVVRRDLLITVGGFDVSMPRYQDWELFIRLSKVCDFFFIDEPLVLAFFSEGAISGNRSSHFCAVKIIYDKNMSDIETSAALKGAWMLKFADAYLRSGRRRAGVSCIFKALKYGGLRFRTILMLCFALIFNGPAYESCMLLASKIKARLRQRYLRKYLGLVSPNF